MEWVFTWKRQHCNWQPVGRRVLRSFTIKYSSLAWSPTRLPWEERRRRGYWDLSGSCCLWDVPDPTLTPSSPKGQHTTGSLAEWWGHVKLCDLLPSLPWMTSCTSKRCQPLNLHRLLLALPWFLFPWLLGSPFPTREVALLSDVSDSSLTKALLLGRGRARQLMEITQAASCILICLHQVSVTGKGRQEHQQSYPSNATHRRKPCSLLVPDCIWMCWHGRSNKLETESAFVTSWSSFPACTT